MISIETSVTGSQIAQDASDSFIKSLSDYAGSTEAESITALCEKIIGALRDT